MDYEGSAREDQLAFSIGVAPPWDGRPPACQTRANLYQSSFSTGDFMPAPADRPARRAHLAQLAIKIIGTEGMNAATIRRLATEAGYSTAIVTHYFPNKRDLLFNTYEHVSETAIAHFESVAADPAGSIEQVMETFLPIGEEEENSWKVVFAFWQLALHDEDFAARQRVAMQRSQDRCAAHRAATARHGDGDQHPRLVRAELDRRGEAAMPARRARVGRARGVAPYITSWARATLPAVSQWPWP
jgi:AcrR family transcriptional regulator